MSDHMMQWPVLLFIGMVAFFGVGLIFGTVAEALNERKG